MLNIKAYLDYPNYCTCALFDNYESFKALYDQWGVVVKYNGRNISVKPMYIETY